jgi:hypothetical protein
MTGAGRAAREVGPRPCPDDDHDDHDDPFARAPE